MYIRVFKMSRGSCGMWPTFWDGVIFSLSRVENLKKNFLVCLPKFKPRSSPVKSEECVLLSACLLGAMWHDGRFRNRPAGENYSKQSVCAPVTGPDTHISSGTANRYFVRCVYDWKWELFVSSFLKYECILFMECCPIKCKLNDLWCAEIILDVDTRAGGRTCRWDGHRLQLDVCHIEVLRGDTSHLLTGL